MKNHKETLVQVSQVLFVFGLSLPFTYFFSLKVGMLLFGGLNALSGWQLVGLLAVSETGLLLGSAYATLAWIMAMKFFLTREEIEYYLSQHSVPFISEVVRRIFEFAYEKPGPIHP